MSNIKFKSEDSRELEFAKELKKRAKDYFSENNLSKKGDYRMYLKSFILLALYITPFILILTLNISAWMALLLVVIMGIGKAGIGMSVMHDGAHGAYSKNSIVNTFAASSMYLLGSNTINWKVQHNLNHHTFTNIYKHDPDISTKAIIRLSDHAPLKKYMRFQQYYAFFLYGFMTFLKLFGDFSRLNEYNKEGHTKRMGAKPSIEITKLIVSKILYILIIIGLPLFFTGFSFFQILLGFLVLHLTAGMIMSTVFQMAHVVTGINQSSAEDGMIHNDRLVHQLNTTSDFGKKSGLLSWYIGGLDFQVEHHLFPSVCHIHYAELSSIVEATAKEFGFQYNSNRTFGHALVSHFKRLKELGRVKVNLA